MDSGYFRKAAGIEMKPLALRNAPPWIWRLDQVLALARCVERFGQILLVFALRERIHSFVLIDGYRRD